MRNAPFVAFLAALLVSVPSASAYDFGDCTYSSADGTTITSLVCPDAPPPVSVLSGSTAPVYVSGALLLGYYDGKPVQAPPEPLPVQIFVIKAFFLPAFFFFLLVFGLYGWFWKRNDAVRQKDLR